MTDYQEEQQNELEALESIYPDELTVVAMEPFPCFQLPISTEDDSECVKCVLQFTYTAKYPDEAPLMEIAESENVDDELLTVLLEYMKEQVRENLGMVMVFTIVSSVQERLISFLEDAEKNRIEAEEKRVWDLEEAERKRFEGTRVQIETFLVWKAGFDAEMAELKALKNSKVKDAPQKLTGKELFMRDHTLDDSDVKFLERGASQGDSVQVDESLFQDMEDLDLGDEDLDLS
ncbi:hypothetical protein CAPTEDRAFT_124119 [Capitella teleta]|uniref:RWD domain-containing protein n=1 Tax=Capitella teleta TaxID=283909 RepID=R7TT32_CAPTE|nr:hypothetical protein CAPTEDRAFT_124119 [Capitella teleta]|eukprot:ELT96772.1 hypothetical protein CAPTEDRAFT_124119 [Capitella teleta]